MSPTTPTIAAAYKQTHDELRETLARAKKLPEDQVKSGLSILQSQLAAPTAQTAIGDEVKDLGNRAAMLTKAFATVNALLALQDAEAVEVQKLIKTWAALSLVSSSYNTRASMQPSLSDLHY